MYVIGARKEAVSSIVDIWLDVFVQVYSRTSHHTGDEWKDEISMKLFTQRRKGFAVLISLAFLDLIMSACGAGGSTSPTAPAAPVNGKGCTKVGILLPETATTARWDGQDRSRLIKDLVAGGGSQNRDY